MSMNEIYVTEENSGKVSAHLEHTMNLENFFKAKPDQGRSVRTLLTKGVSGIGKTVLTQKFALDWAEDKVNDNIQFVFLFTFRELNLLKEKKYSWVELLHHFFADMKEVGIRNFDKLQIVFILDGLDEYQLPFDFHSCEILTDVTDSASVDVLLTNLIMGKLFPSAFLWITTTPNAASQIPPEYIHMVTEVKGFTDPEKEYFRKRFRNKELTKRIISDIKASRRLNSMCHIPVFCWITAKVFEDMLESGNKGELPKTMTEMYTHFLVVQFKQANVKCHGQAGTDSLWDTETSKMILSLGKLAFEQLQKGNLIFYEADLKEYGIDIRAASNYSGVFSQIFKKEHGLNQDQLFTFLHLSFQEFLAAVYVIVSFFNSGVNLLSEEQSTSLRRALNPDQTEVEHFLQSAVNKALQSPNKHLDLFLRFLFGLSVQTHQTLLLELLEKPRSSLQSHQNTVQYIKKMIRENPSPEQCISLFHCLNELSDDSVMEEIQQSLSSGCLSPNQLSRAQWSALVFILLSSESELDMFDLKKFCPSEDGLLRFLPVVQASTLSLWVHNLFAHRKRMIKNVKK